MYDELVKRLREVEEMLKMAQFKEAAALIEQAADAIENLDCIAETYAETVHELKDKNRWIPVSERVPKGGDKSGELCENVWLFFDDGNVCPGWMNGITEKVYYLDNYNSSIMTAPISRVKMWQFARLTRRQTQTAFAPSQMRHWLNGLQSWPIAYTALAVIRMTNVTQ